MHKIHSKNPTSALKKNRSSTSNQ